MSSTRTHRQLSVLIAHKDPAWIGEAKQRLEAVGYKVTDCLELDWVPDLLSGSRPYDLACVSSEIDPASQAAILRAIQNSPQRPKLLLLLDQFDSASIHFKSHTGVLTHRVSGDITDFVRAVVDQLGVPLRPRV